MVSPRSLDHGRPCSMPLTDVMGFINAYVEHEGLKVIVIANQDEIPDAQKAEYERRKEKLIGRTLRIASDPSSVFEEFIALMKNDAARKAAANLKEAVLRSFRVSGKENLKRGQLIFEGTIRKPNIKSRHRYEQNRQFFVGQMEQRFKSFNYIISIR